MGNNTGINPLNPNKYLGPNVYLNIIVSRNRQPTGADYRQPETGVLYQVNTLWQVGKNPTTGIEGQIFILTKIVGNVAYWDRIASSNNSISWNVATTNQTLGSSQGWFSNGGAQLQFTLPATSTVGDTYEVVAMNAAGWIIKQGAGQQITVGTNQTTLGAAGSVASLNRGDWIRIVCNVANTGFFATILEGNCVTV